MSRQTLQMAGFQAGGKYPSAGIQIQRMVSPSMMGGYESNTTNEATPFFSSGLTLNNIINNNESPVGDWPAYWANTAGQVDIKIDLEQACPVEMLAIAGGYGTGNINRPTSISIGHNNTSLTDAYTTLTGVSSLTPGSGGGPVGLTWVCNLRFAPTMSRYWNVMAAVAGNLVNTGASQAFFSIFNVELWAKNTAPTPF